MEQRYVPLSFTAGAGNLTATAPASANIAPPGVYMLFIVDANGVPSIAKMVSVGTTAPPPPPPPPPPNVAPTVAITSPANGATFKKKASITTTATAADSDGTVARVEFLRDGTLVGQDATAPYSSVWANANPGKHTLTARAVDNAGATASASVTVTVTPK
jgi:hypothetical protein